MQQDWQQWKYINKEKIQHIAGYEEKFVDEILSKIAEITPNDVIPQYHFKDSKNGNRYIDFMILNREKGYSLPIELDGYAKINNKGYEKFNDFLERQNDLIKSFGVVLRYTNKKAFEQSHIVIREIQQALKAQAEHQVTEKTKQQQVQKLIQEYENKIAEYDQRRVSESKSTVEKERVEQAKKVLESFKQSHDAQLQHVHNELSAIKGQQSKELSSVKNHIQKQIYIGVGAIAVIVLSSMIYLKSSSTNDVVTEPQAFVSTDQIENQHSTTLPSQHETSIEAQQAYNFLGQNQIVCGTVAQYKAFSKGIYLNFDYPYPQATFTAVIWDSEREISQKLLNIKGHTLCIRGVIEEYKGKPQMNLKSLDQIV